MIPRKCHIIFCKSEILERSMFQSIAALRTRYIKLTWQLTC